MASVEEEGWTVANSGPKVKDTRGVRGGRGRGMGMSRGTGPRHGDMARLEGIPGESPQHPQRWRHAATKIRAEQQEAATAAAAAASSSLLLEGGGGTGLSINGACLYTLRVGVPPPPSPLLRPPYPPPCPPPLSSILLTPHALLPHTSTSLSHPPQPLRAWRAVAPPPPPLPPPPPPLPP